MLNGVDVSGYQPGNIMDLIPADFALIKATEGTSYVSPTCDQQYQSTVRRGKCVGVYHFSRADNHPGTQGAHAEAEWFVKNIQGYLNGQTILVLDHEANSASAGGAPWALDFLTWVTYLTKFKPMLYGSRGIVCLPSYGLVKDYPLWVAAYGSNAVVNGYQPSLRSPGDISPWEVVTCFQYGSRGLLPGYGAYLDLDVFYGDRETWLKLAAPIDVDDPIPTQKSVHQLADEVIAGQWGNGDERIRLLTEAGYDAAAVQAEVNRILGVQPRKTVQQLAQEVIAGLWGNGSNRQHNLEAAGYDYNAVQAEVNRILGVSRKSNWDIATEVIRGLWGNGAVRRQRLTAAGYDYNAIMKIVNSRL